MSHKFSLEVDKKNDTSQGKVREQTQWWLLEACTDQMAFYHIVDGKKGNH